MSTGYESNYPASGYASESQIRNEFEKIQQALEDTISRSGTSNSSGTDNAMSTFLNMDGNDIINAGSVYATSIFLRGTDLLGEVQRAIQAADRAEQAADDLGGPYEFVGDYAPDITLTKYKQLVRDSNGEFWRVSGQVDLPYTTTGTGLPEGDAFVPAGDAALRQDLANPDKGAAMVAYGDGTVADMLGEIVSGAVTEPIVDAKVLAHNHDADAHPELSAFISEEADRAQSAADQAEDAYVAIYNSGALQSASVYETIADGLAGVADDEYFWVYPNNLNSIDSLTLFKRVDAMTEELLFVQYNLNAFMIEEGANWEMGQ